MKVHEAVVTALYEDPAARASFLAQGQAEPQDAALLAEINADGQVTIDEFRNLTDVRNAVHNHGGGIVTFFEQQVVELQRPG